MGHFLQLIALFHFIMIVSNLCQTHYLQVNFDSKGSLQRHEHIQLQTVKFDCSQWVSTIVLADSKRNPLGIENKFNSIFHEDTASTNMISLFDI